MYSYSYTGFLKFRREIRDEITVLKFETLSYFGPHECLATDCASAGMPCFTTLFATDLFFIRAGLKQMKRNNAFKH